MGVSSRIAGVRVDKSAMTPFGNPAGSFALTTAYQTLQSITGKGYLDVAILVGAAGVNSLRIKVDGIVTFEGSSNSATYSTGFTKRDLLLSSGANLAIVNPATPYINQNLNAATGFIFGYPYTANATQAQTLSVNADSIYFLSSLLIEAKTGTGNTAGYYLSGGYQ